MTGAVAAAPLRDLIGGPPVRAEVLGGGPRALYLRHPTGRLLALLAPDAVALPLGVVLDAPCPPQHGPAQVGGGRVRFPSADVVVRGWFPTAVGAVRPAPGTREWCVRRAAELDEGHTGLTRAQRTVLRTALDDPDAVSAALCGSGPGLTPAGDDALCGVLTTAAAGLLPLPSGWAKRVVEHAVHATTDLSAQLLRLAAEGQVATPIWRLFRALERPARLPDGWDEVLAMGHTSGAAFAVGFGAALTWRP
jgi:Protein of unknown function (DUF2877)